MPKTLAQHKDQVHVVEVVHHGEQIILPEAMDLDDGIQALRARKEYLQEEISVNHEFKVFPWDGAVALSAVLTKKFGWSQSIAVPGFFGSQPPQMINVDVDHNKSVSVAWGRFNIPTLDYGYIECSHARKDGLIIFAISVAYLIPFLFVLSSFFVRDSQANSCNAKSSTSFTASEGIFS